jgi:hypothetical protein
MMYYDKLVAVELPVTPLTLIVTYHGTSYSFW